MKIATLRGNGLLGNKIFDLQSNQNRDNCFEPYVRLKNEFLKNDIILNTSDINKHSKVDFELHQDVQSESESTLNYLMMFETNYVAPSNQKQDLYKNYKRIFTWRDDLVDGDRFIKFNFPNPIVIPEVDGWSRRDKFSALIAGNKSLPMDDDAILYPERVKLIRWFEKHAPKDLFLYGPGWDLPVPVGGVRGLVIRHLCKTLYPLLDIKPFPSYRGMVSHKKEVLTKTKFLICYENISDQPGYITEKIFDAFFAGCVPVYWGADNILSYIPQECFIDRRKFPDTKSLYIFLKNMSESQFIAYQENIARFLASPMAYPFSSEFFSQTVVNCIKDDLRS